MTKLQTFITKTKVNLDMINQDGIFFCNNGQKIIVGNRQGFIFTYERNSDGLTWKQFSNKVLPNRIVYYF